MEFKLRYDSAHNFEAGYFTCEHGCRPQERNNNVFHEPGCPGNGNGSMVYNFGRAIGFYLIMSEDHKYQEPRIKITLADLTPELRTLLDSLNF